jgi:AcrR family transcriptional regulator
LTEPSTERGRQSRVLIVEAAAELVAIGGIEGTTLSDIAAENQLTTGTFYRYFDGKRSLFRTLFEDFAARLIEELQEPAVHGDLRPFIMAWLDVSSAHPGAVRVREELLSTDPEFVAVWRTYRPMLENLIAQAMADRFPQRPAFAPALIYDALEHQTRANMMGWQSCGNARFAGAMADLLENGLYLRDAEVSSASGPRRKPVDYQPALEWAQAEGKRAPSSARGKKTVEKIQQAAEKVFARKGIASTTIRDIAEEAGISAGSAYQYFQDKEEVFTSLAVVAERAIIERSFLPLDEHYAQDFVHSYLRYIEVYREHSGTFRAWWDLTEPTGTPSRAWDSVRTHFLEHFERVVKYGQRKGVVRRKADPRAIGEVYADLHERIAYRHLVTGDIDIPDQNIANFLENLFKRPF